MISSDELNMCITEYKRQYEVTYQQLQELEQQYQQQKQNLQTALMMSAGAVAAFEHLRDSKTADVDKEASDVKDEYGG